jgi:Trk K+ transport system NAD-binding subunit
LPEALREDVEMLVPLTFMIILGTVTLNGLSAKLVSRLLGVTKQERNGVVIVGANEGSISIAKYLNNNDINTSLIDLSKENVRIAKSQGLNVEERNVLADDQDNIDVEDAGHLLALTSSNDVNIFACRKLKHSIGESRVYRLITINEIKFDALSKPQNVLFSGDSDYIKLIEMVRANPDLKEISIESKEQFSQLTSNKAEFIPVLIRNGQKIQFITVNFDYQFEKDDFLAYIGNL